MRINVSACGWERSVIGLLAAPEPGHWHAQLERTLAATMAAVKPCVSDHWERPAENKADGSQAPFRSGQSNRELSLQVGAQTCTQLLAFREI
jgi:hypothetical protein